MGLAQRHSAAEPQPKTQVGLMIDDLGLLIGEGTRAVIPEKSSRK
jgi:hypothetical protein